jgi:hypothetical protein
MPQYRFEIVGRAFDRFTWRLVELGVRRRRILARSDQDYSSLEKVGAAIADFRAIVAGAGVVNTTAPSEGPFPLPPTRFEFVPGVVPLVVEEFPNEDDGFSEDPLEPARQEPAQQEPARQEQSSEPAGRSKQGVPASTRESATRSSGRRRKGT